MALKPNGGQITIREQIIEDPVSELTFQTSDIRSYLQQSATEYVEARQSLDEAAAQLETRRLRLEEAMRRYYRDITDRDLPIRHRN